MDDQSKRTAIHTTVWDPIEKKTHGFSRSVKKWGEGEARRLVAEWKEKKMEEMRLKRNGMWKERLEETTKKYSNKSPAYTSRGAMWNYPEFVPFSNHFFDLKETTGSSICMFGSSKSGKTTIMKQIIQLFDPKKYIVVIMAENIHSPVYADLPKEVIKLAKFIGRIVELAFRIQRLTKNHYKFVFFVDDVVTEKENKILKKMILTYRNSNISTVIALQDTMLLKKTERLNINHAIFTYQNNEEGREDAVEKFLNGYMGGRRLKMADKTDIYKRLTADHQFIALDLLDGTMRLSKVTPGRDPGYFTDPLKVDPAKETPKDASLAVDGAVDKSEQKTGKEPEEKVSKSKEPKIEENIEPEKEESKKDESDK